MTDPHNTGEKLPIGRPFANGHDPRRNAGGRPQGLSRLAREAVADGRDLIDFYLAVFKGDTKALHTRKIRLQDRIQAAEWLAERGFGKTPLVVDIPGENEPQVDFYDSIRTWAESLPPDLRQALGDFLDSQFIAAIDSDISVIDEQIKAKMPTSPPRD